MQTNEEVEMIRETTRRFVRTRLAPLENDIEASDEVNVALLASLRQEASALGLYGFNLPEELGGLGLSTAAKLAILEEITYTSVPLSEVIGHLPLSMKFFNEKQKKELLPGIVKGEKIITYALTEPGAGSDLTAIRTRAQQTQGGWLLNGSKQFISHAETADYILVLALTDADAPLKNRFTTFIVARDNPGLVGMTRYKKMGWRGYHLNGFSLENCKVTDSDIVGKVGDGFLTMIESINHDRIFSASRSLGLSQRAQEMACQYSKERITFGSKISEHQAIQFMLADNDVEIEAARLMIQRAAELVYAGNIEGRIAASRAKLYASEMGCRVTDRALQIFGGMGYMCDLPIERFYRDARAFRIGEGTSEMQRIQIARHVLSSK